MRTVTRGSSGRGIRIVRVGAGFTQEQVGSRAHLSQQEVSLLERGARRLRPDLAARLEQAIRELVRERGATR